MAQPTDLSSASSLEQQAYLISLAMVEAELAQPEEDRPDNAQVAFDTEAQTVSISITLDTTIATQNGSAVIGVTSYLP